MPPALLDDLIGWLRIPSISTGGGRRADLDAAAQSAVTRVREAGVAMVDADTPAITVSLRGIVQLSISVRVAERDLHSGMYGGTVQNALHALHTMLAPLHSLELGERAARELPLEIAQLPT